MNEKEIAHQRNDLGRDVTFPSRDKWYRPSRKRKGGFAGDPLFRDKVASYIESIPDGFVGMKHCPACEGVLCGICGKCHELDRRSFRSDPACPNARHMLDTDDTDCLAWSYAYLYLKEA
jgi:hypothetical protein